MISSQKLKIHYKDIPLRIQTYFGDKVKDASQLDHWDFDLRSQTFLHRDAGGNYEFAHKSLAEYFVAFKFAAELGCLAPEFKDTYREENGQNCQIPIEVKGVEELSKTFGSIPTYDSRLKTVNEMLKEMLAKDTDDLLWSRLSEIKDKFQKKTPNHAVFGFVWKNIATILYGWLGSNDRLEKRRL